MDKEDMARPQDVYQRLGLLETSVAGILVKLDTLTKVLETSSDRKWPWGALATCVVALAAFAGSYTNLQTGYNREALNRILDRVETIEANKAEINASRFTRRDHERYSAAVDDRLDAIDFRIDAHTSNGHPNSVLALVEELRRDVERLKDRLDQP